EPQVGDGAGGGGDRVPSLLWVHARVRRAAVERNFERLRERSAEDHVTDRRGLVVDEPMACVQPPVCECGRPEQADLLLRREHELDPGIGSPFREHPPRRVEHHRDGGLVVSAQDRPGRVPHHSVIADDRAYVTGGRNRVEMRAEEDRPPWSRRLDPRVQVAGRRADSLAGIVLVYLERAVTEVGDDDVGDGPLLARRTWDRRKLGEELQHFGHGSYLSGDECDGAALACSDERGTNELPEERRRTRGPRLALRVELTR